MLTRFNAILGVLFVLVMIVGPPQDALWPRWCWAPSPGSRCGDAAAWLAFHALGWTWGGDWRSLKDYQHFSASGGRPLTATVTGVFAPDDLTGTVTEGVVSATGRPVATPAWIPSVRRTCKAFPGAR